MAADFGITSSPAAKKRRQRHDGSRTQILRFPRFFLSDDGGGMINGSYHRHATINLLDDKAEQCFLLLVRQQMSFGRIGQRY